MRRVASLLIVFAFLATASVSGMSPDGFALITTETHSGILIYPSGFSVETHSGILIYPSGFSVETHSGILIYPSGYETHHGILIEPSGYETPAFAEHLPDAD